MEQVVVLNDRYIPGENEPYMSEGQIRYFREKLKQKKDELAQKLNRTINRIKALEGVQADILDRSNSYIDLEREVSNFERYNAVLGQIERALRRIDEGSFGYCEMTGSEIGLRRLEAIPFATMSIQALEEFEAAQKQQFRPVRSMAFS